jgi:FkbM family methyltransferase
MKDLITKKPNGFYWAANGSYTYDVLSRDNKHLEHIQPHLKNTNTMVQAGGNCGLVLEPFVSVFQDIYTFEPDPLNFYCLNLNITSPNVHKFQACLGDSHKLVAMGNLYDNDNGAFYVKSSGKIPTFTIDDLNLDTCDLIMLDIEGYEVNALKGAKDTIEKYKPVICVEAYSEWLSRYGSSIDDLEKTIFQFGYRYASSYSPTSDRIYVPL